jgi:hypothetical protein
MHIEDPKANLTAWILRERARHRQRQGLASAGQHTCVWLFKPDGWDCDQSQRLLCPDVVLGCQRCALHSKQRCLRMPKLRIAQQTTVDVRCIRTVDLALEFRMAQHHSLATTPEKMQFFYAISFFIRFYIISCSC